MPYIWVKRHLVQKLLSGDTDTHTSDRLLYLDHWSDQ